MAVGLMGMRHNRGDGRKRIKSCFYSLKHIDNWMTQLLLIKPGPYKRENKQNNTEFAEILKTDKHTSVQELMRKITSVGFAVRD